MNLDPPWSVPRVRSADEVVFVLGAGASKDAGLPLARELTATLREQLVGRIPGFTEVLEAVDRLSTSATDDYEQLFWWLRTLLDKARLRDLVGLVPRGARRSTAS